MYVTKNYKGALRETHYDTLMSIIKSMSANMERMYSCDLKTAELHRLTCPDDETYHLLSRAGAISKEGSQRFSVKLDVDGESFDFNMHTNNQILPPAQWAGQVRANSYMPAYQKLLQYAREVVAVRTQFQAALDVVALLNKTVNNGHQMAAAFPVLSVLVDLVDDEKMRAKMVDDTRRPSSVPRLPEGFKDVAQTARMAITQAQLMPQMPNPFTGREVVIGIGFKEGIKRPWGRGMSL